MKTTIIDTEDLKALFDVAVNSMDFGSGFLETDDVNMLRRIAVTIGVDPSVATPRLFRKQYPHPFEKKPYYQAECYHCDAQEESACHVQ